MTPTGITHILFDLDGTLTDPKAGIVGSIRHALDTLGCAAPADLEWCIGPPLRESFAILLDSSDPDRIAGAVSAYRERYAAIGMYENSVYDGVAELLASLSAMGYRVVVATSKPWFYAEQIVRHFGLAEFLGHVYGSELDGARSDKGELIGYILEREGVGAETVMMIGDRRHDLAGAFSQGVRAAGVAYGYGSLEELGGAEVVFGSPGEIGRFFEGREI